MEENLWFKTTCGFSLPDSNGSSRAAFSVTIGPGAQDLNQSCAVISSSEEHSFSPLQVHLLCHLPLPKMQTFRSPLAARTRGIFASFQDKGARFGKSRGFFVLCLCLCEKI